MGLTAFRGKRRRKQPGRLALLVFPDLAVAAVVGLALGRRAIFGEIRNVKHRKPRLAVGGEVYGNEVHRDLFGGYRAPVWVLPVGRRDVTPMWGGIGAVEVRAFGGEWRWNARWANDLCRLRSGNLAAALLCILEYGVGVVTDLVRVCKRLSASGRGRDEIADLV